MICNNCKGHEFKYISIISVDHVGRPYNNDDYVCKNCGLIDYEYEEDEFNQDFEYGHLDIDDYTGKCDGDYEPESLYSEDINGHEQ
jgi:hypothetical protein